MKRIYSIIPKATITIEAPDATYIIEVKREYLQGKTWEFDPNSDAVGQYETHATDKILISITPVKKTMQFPEDANRRCEYIMPVEDARELYRFLRNKKPHFWFALDKIAAK